MPGFKRSQSQKKSKSQSQTKNGGRLRKHTMRKLRRVRKSRKVMRGGQGKDISSHQLAAQLNRDGVMTYFLERYFNVQEVTDIKKFTDFDDFQTHYNNRFNQGKIETYGKFNIEELKQRLALNDGQKHYNENDPDVTKLKMAILTLAV